MPKNNLERRSSWTLLSCAALLAATGTIGLFYLLWSYVPHHAQHFAEVGASIPLSTRVAIAFSNLFVRLFPIFLVVGIATVGATIVALLVVSQKALFRKTIKVASFGILLVALAEIIGCALVFYAIRAAY